MNIRESPQGRRPRGNGEQLDQGEQPGGAAEIGTKQRHERDRHRKEPDIAHGYGEDDCEQFRAGGVELGEGDLTGQTVDADRRGNGGAKAEATVARQRAEAGHAAGDRHDRQPERVTATTQDDGAGGRGRGATVGFFRQTLGPCFPFRDDE